jgi:hypothetical protein
MSETLERFREVAVASGIDNRLLRAADGERNVFGGYAIGYYEPLLVINALAARLLRRNPEEVLTHDPIPLQELEPNRASLIAARTINASRTPKFMRPTEFKIADLAMFACPTSDWRFGETIRQRGMSGYGFQIFYGQDGQPAFLRKGLNRPLSLSLRDFTADGIPFAEGTICNVLSIRDELDSLTHEPFLSSRRVTAYPYRDVYSVTPLRLSAYALPPEQRVEHFGEGIDVVKDLTIAGIRQAVLEIIEERDVQVPPA